MGSGSTKGAKTTSTNEVVADVILPGATEAFTVRGKVGRPKPTPEHTDDAERDSVTNTRLFTGSDNRPVPDETETSKTIGNKQYHQPTGKISGSHREEVRPKSAAAKKSSTATVTEVAKDTYTIEYENQRFDVSGSEFSTFLQDAAEMTVTDTLKVSDPFQAGGSGKTFQFKVLKPQSGEGPMRLQLQNRYMEVEDLEEDVIDEILGVPVTSNKENESPDEKISEKKEQMRQALQMKKTQLTKEQYEQMIANHKQETELMELIRKKEKNRQQIALEEKMNQRRIRKKRKEAEKREQDLLLAGQASQYQSTKGKSSQESEMDENKKKEIEDEIAKKNSEFERELQLKKHQLSEHEYQLIIAEHKQHMIEMTKDLEIAGERQKQALAAKLEERKKRRARKAEKVKLQQDVVTDASVYVSDDSDVEMGEENKLKKIQKEIDKKNGKFARDVELRRRNGEISDEEYQRLQKEHNSDIQRLVNKLQEEKARQQQAVQNKLGSKKSGAWQTKEEQEKMLDNQLADEVAATKSEVSEIEMQMARAKTQFEEEMKKKRNKISKEEYEKLLAEHEEEMERLRRKLDRGKDRQRLALLEKLANRKKKRGMKLTEEEERAKLLAALKNKEVLSEEQLRLLQKDIAQYRSEFDEDMKKRRSQLSPEEYERIMADHKKDMEDLEKKLQQEKEKMGMSLADKIAARKMKKKGKTTPEDEVLDQIGEEITDIEVEIQKKEKEFQKKIERGKMSNADYAKLLAEHDEEMERLRRKLALQKDRQRQKLLEKIAARKNKKDMRATEEEQRAKLLAALKNQEVLSEEEIKMLEKDIDNFDQEVVEDASRRLSKGQISQEEYERILCKHQNEMEALEVKLLEEKSRMDAKLAAKIAGRIEKKQNDAGSSDEWPDLDEQQLQKEIFPTETSLWTTPVQSKDIVLVPLLDEYPVRKRKELYTDPAIFREIDKHAIECAQTVNLVVQPTFASLVDVLVDPAKSELQKVRLVFRWITAQNCQEMDFLDVIDDTPLGVLKGIYQKKITWSTLFMRMCRYVGLKCVEIPGRAKKAGFVPGQSISSENPDFYHTWNAVCIDSYWHFVDCNWGVSHISSSKAFDPFRYQYDEHYFLADPEVIIRTHFPNDPAWQLLVNPFTQQDFMEDLVLKPDFFAYGFVPMSHTKCLILAENGDVNLKMAFPKGFIVTCQIFALDHQIAQTQDGVPFSAFIFQQQVADNVLSFYMRFPDPGSYYWVFYAKKHFLDGDFNIETATEICCYKVDSQHPSADSYPLPQCPLQWWGPIGVENFGLTALAQNAVIMCKKEDAVIQFKVSDVNTFVTSVTAYQAQEGQFQPFVVQSESDGVVTFRFSPPCPSRFGFHIYTPNTSSSQGGVLPICSYLIVCTEAKINIRPYPHIQNQWGPTEAFNSMGLEMLGDPNPVILTKDGDSRLQFRFNRQLNLSYTFMYYAGPAGQDLTQTVYCEPGENQITFLLFMEQCGNYHLLINATDPNDPYTGKLPVFNYLIIKE